MEFTQKYFEGNSAAHARAVYKGSGYERNVHKYIVFEENITDKRDAGQNRDLNIL